VGAAGASGCGSSSKSNGGPSAGGGGDDGSGGDAGVLGGGDGGTAGRLPDGGAASGSDCADSTKLVYVVSHENGLYAFDPQKLTFKAVGFLGCAQQTGGASAFSMAIDRQGTAWVLYSDGSIWKVSTK